MEVNKDKINLGISKKGQHKAETKDNVKLSVELKTGKIRVSDKLNNAHNYQNFTIKLVNFDVVRETNKLIEGGNMTLEFGRRYGIVAPNGQGKTSLMQAIADREILGIPEDISMLLVKQEAEASDVSAKNYVINSDVERLELLIEKEKLEEEEMDEFQVERYSEVMNRLKEIGAFQADGRASIILHGLQFTDEMMKQPTKSFSGGWRMRIALAQALFLRPELLLLDEPTNHLDLFAAVWLEEFLCRWKKTLVVVSHDRELLNSVCTDIYQIYQQKLHHYRGNFDNYEHAFREHRRIMEKSYEKQNKRLKEIEKMRQNVAKNEKQAKDKLRQTGSKSNGKSIGKSKKNSLQKSRAIIKSKEQSIENEELMDKPPKLYEPSFFFPDAGDMPYPIINVINNANFSYSPDEIILKELDFCIDNHSRITIVGRNGVGKSTLLKLIMGELKPNQGNIIINPRLRFGCFNQHLIEQLDVSVSAVTYLMNKYNIHDVSEVRRILGGYGLTGDQHTIPIRELSGGQKVRVAFTELYYQKPHILFLDEPTNHLDIESVDALISAIVNFPGAVILITHNQALIKKACEEIWIVEDQKVRVYRDSYDNYLNQILETLEFLDD